MITALGPPHLGVAHGHTLAYGAHVLGCHGEQHVVLACRGAPLTVKYGAALRQRAAEVAQEDIHARSVAGCCFGAELLDEAGRELETAA